MDPLTAFSAAGNALQFAEFGVKVVLKTIEYANGGGDLQYQRLQDLSQQLTVSNAHLHQTLVETASQPIPPGPARAVHYANEECLKVANEFLDILNEFRFNRTRSLWRSVMLSMKSIKTKSEIENISVKVGHARSNLVLSLLVYLQTEVSSNTQQFRADHQEIIEEARRITKRTSAIQADVTYLNEKFTSLQVDAQAGPRDVDRGLKKVDNDQSRPRDPERSNSHAKGCISKTRPSKTRNTPGFDALNAKTETAPDQQKASASSTDNDIAYARGFILHEIAEEAPKPESPQSTELDEKYEQDRNELLYISTKRHDQLQGLTQRFSNTLMRLNHRLVTMSSEFDDLAPLIDRELLGRRRVLESLYFTKMNDRRNGVARAHNQTFQWIFRKSKENENVVWDDFFDWLCNQEQNPIYWIFGKPGCGKTTMVRELDERIVQQAYLQDWTEGRELLKLSCYFWWAGTAEQKSLLGFLRNVLYQLFQQRPDLIDKALQRTWWQEALMPQLQLHAWEENDLVQAIHSVLRATEDSKVLMFVDGLDEFDGTDESRDHFLNLLVSLTAYPHVKVCVASRYWNIFRDRFQNCPKIRLEDLTVDDINSYVREKLGEDALFRKQQKRWNQQQDGNLLDRISEEIISKARGVFLWVRLAVRDLLKVLRDGGRPNQLFQELKSIPSDLDDYFTRMMESVDKSYRKDASMILQTALCNMDYSPDGGKTLVSGPDLLLVHLEYLDDKLDPCFAIKSRLHTIDYIQDEDDIDDLLELLDRRLMSRCMGLLEIDTLHQWACKAERHPWTTKVEFLHRTVRDFLLKRSTQQILREYSHGDFDAHLFRCNTLVANVNMPTEVNGPELRFGSFACFFRQIQERQKDDKAAAALFESMVDLVNMQADDLSSFVEGSGTSHILADDTFIKCIWSCLDTNSTTTLIQKLDTNGYVDLSKQTRPTEIGNNHHEHSSTTHARKRPHEDREHPLAYLDRLARPMLDPKIEQSSYEEIARDDHSLDQQDEREYFDVLEPCDEEPSCKKFKPASELDAAYETEFKMVMIVEEEEEELFI